MGSPSAGGPGHEKKRRHGHQERHQLQEKCACDPWKPPPGSQRACGDGRGPSWEGERLAPPWGHSPSRPLRTSSAMPWEQDREQISRREQDEGKMERGLCHPPHIYSLGRPTATSTTSHHHDPLHAASTSQVEQLPRQHGEAESPTSNQSSHVIKGAGG